MSWNLQPVDPQLPTPVHRQIHRALRDAIVSDGRAPGTKLPSVNELSHLFGANRLTVLKAVHRLMDAGLLKSVKGKGIFVAAIRGDDGDERGDMEPEGRFFEGIAEGAEIPLGTDGSDSRGALGRFVSDSLDDRVISFAAGFPPKDLLPVEAIRRHMSRVLAGDIAKESLGYAPSKGSPALIARIRDLLLQRGLVLDDDDHIVVTAGAQQALSLCLRRYFENRGALVVESPGYMGIIAACRQRNVPLIPVPVDRGGINPKCLAQALEHSEVRGIYTVPTYQNPTGVTQQLVRRKRVLSLAEKRDVLIIEDDTYADLRLGGRAVPPIKSLPGGERVIYAGSFSKSLAPGFRVGFLVAKGELGLELLYHKETADLSTSMFAQSLIASFIESGGYRRHLAAMRREYRKRRDAMAAALNRELGDEIRFHLPKGGLHLFVMFQHPVDIGALAARCRAGGVLFAPGDLFFPDGRRPSALRVNFAAHDEKTINIGIRRLAECFRQEKTI